MHCCNPEGPTPAPELEPRLLNVGGAYKWRIAGAGDPEGLRAGGWRLKCEAADALAALDRRRWLAAAYESLDRKGVLCGAPRPTSAADPWQHEPYDQRPDWWDGVVRGHQWTCGQAACPDWSNPAAKLAQLRFGWDDRRASAAYVLPQWDPERIRWYEALQRASEDLRAGVSDDEARLLGADEATVGYLRLEHELRRSMSRLQHAPTPSEAAKLLSPESWTGQSTCWAPPSGAA